MNPQIIIALVIAACGFGSAWQIQSWRFDAKEKDRAEQALVDQRLQAAATIRQSQAVIASQSAAAVRATTLRRDADGARVAIVSLHDAAEQALRDAQASHAACTERATALGDVLQASTERYRELGEKADRHASDVQTLIDAWPK